MRQIQILSGRKNLNRSNSKCPLGEPAHDGLLRHSRVLLIVNSHRSLIGPCSLPSHRSVFLRPNISPGEISAILPLESARSFPDGKNLDSGRQHTAP